MVLVTSISGLSRAKGWPSGRLDRYSYMYTSNRHVCRVWQDHDERCFGEKKANDVDTEVQAMIGLGQ